MGGDNAPRELVRGAVAAAFEYGVDIVMIGNKDEIEKIAREDSLDISSVEIVHTEVKIEMDDDAVSVVRSKKDSSMSR